MDIDSGRILVVVPLNRKASLAAELHQHCIPGWENVVELLADRGPDSKNWCMATQDIKQRLEGLPREDIYLCKDAKYETKSLGGRLPDKRSFELLRDALLKELDRRGLGWRARFETQMKGCGLRATPTDDWLDQFRTLGFLDVGKMLLKNFNLMNSAEMVRTFEVRSAKTLGHQVHFAYFDDGDKAGSDAATKHTLLKLHPESSVGEIRKLLEGPPQDCHIYLFTDGLWSGAEFKKRILILAPQLRARPDVRVFFRFSTVADYGLLFARSLLRAEALQNVEIDVEDQTVPILGDRLEEALSLLQTKSHEEFAGELYGLVEPFVCRKSQIGELDAPLTQSFLNELGYQLALQWVTWDKPHLDDDKKQSRAKKFALGGGGFGLASAFHQSVPKVSLPVFWLGGEITYRDTTIFWKPLLFDVRRQMPQNIGFAD